MPKRWVFYTLAASSTLARSSVSTSLDTLLSHSLNSEPGVLPDFTTPHEAGRTIDLEFIEDDDTLTRFIYFSLPYDFLATDSQNMQLA